MKTGFGLGSVFGRIFCEFDQVVKSGKVVGGRLTSRVRFVMWKRVSKGAPRVRQGVRFRCSVRYSKRDCGVV